ncbi:hypothetical protein [Streptomyces sp. G-G2]|uniref:hypothetical protein n=1 Tax=Streptomyces sp. G-G2 TaxID=3046201 RepID=UPI0024B9A6E7|nr:hypothetical protein [Streptomyces sp. G-G2]MDJ0384320.1 hypothetical protein [Streptomyces sp. G-G2]
MSTNTIILLGVLASFVAFFVFDWLVYGGAGGGSRRGAGYGDDGDGDGCGGADDGDGCGCSEA